MSNSDNNKDKAVVGEATGTQTAPAPTVAATASSAAPAAATAEASDPPSTADVSATTAAATSTAATPTPTSPTKAPRTNRAKASASASSPSASASPPADASAAVSSSPSPSPTSARAPKAARQPRQGKKGNKQQQEQQQQQEQPQAASSSPDTPAVPVVEHAQPPAAAEATTSARGRKPRQQQQAQSQVQTQAQTQVAGEPSSSPPIQASKREARGKQKERTHPTQAPVAQSSGLSQSEVISQLMATQEQLMQQLAAMQLQTQQPATGAAPSPPAAAPATTSAASEPRSAAAAASASPPVPEGTSTPSMPTRKPMQRHLTSAGGTTASPSANTNNSSAGARGPARPTPVPMAAAAAQAPPAVPGPSRPLAASASSLPRNIIVLKVGSASLSTDDCKLLHLSNICNLVETICTLKQKGFQVILVTSGAVAVGCQRLGLTERPTSLVTKQAVAAIGQSRLMRVYDDLFSAMSQPIAQVLLTRENLSAHVHYVNALNTFRELLRMGIVPVVNENDVVSVSELKVGDNDTLSALVASLVQARWLFLLTDVAGLYDSDPRSNPSARIVHTVAEIGDLRVSLGSSGSIGTGGMTTKLVAAGIATAAGVHTGIIKSTELGNIERMMRGDLVGTHFLPVANPLKSHKKWIAHGLKPEGAIILDDGASDSILGKTSLFSAGVVGVQGKFAAGASVRLLRAAAKDAAPATPARQQAGGKKGAGAPSPSPSAPSASPTSPAALGVFPAAAASQQQESAAAPLPAPRGRVYSSAECAPLVEVGVCVVNFEADEVLRLSGQHSREFARILGYDAPAELSNRENIVITFKGAAPSPSPSPAATTATPASASTSASAPQR